MNTPDHLAAELDEVFDHLQETQHPWAVPGNRQQRNSVARLKSGLLVKIVQDDVWNFTPLEFDHDPHAVSIGLVTDIRDALDALVPNEVGDLGDEG